MRNLYFFFVALLLVDGEFGANVTVSVIEGDSVTLKPHTEITKDVPAEWLFGNKIIAKINKAAGLFSTSEGDDVGFNGRLKLDPQTGSLTITNIRTGLYKLQIRGSVETFNIFNVTVRDVVESVSVTEGDTVTLRTGVIKKQKAEQIQWKFGDQDLNGPNDKKWSNIDLNGETGELTIKNIRKNQSGYNKLEINTSSMILHRKLHITVSDEMTTVSVKEGESVTLRTGLIEMKGYDLILWKFEEHLIGEINNRTNRFSLYDGKDERFKGRLQGSEKTVSLIISDCKTTDSGDYQLNMSNSSYTIQRNISVSVKAIPQSMSMWMWIGIVIVIAIVFAIVFMIVTKSWPCRNTRR